MKRAGFALILALTSWTASARAAVIVNVSVNEYGNGSTDFMTPLHSLPSGMAADPTGGFMGQILGYVLPFTAVQGDLRLNEIAGVAGLSDVIRFFNLGQGGMALIFYSDKGDGVDATADLSGLPGNALTNAFTLQEMGPEGGPNGANYTPTAGQPGYISNDFTVTYHIMSDSVPEPASVGLLAAGLVGLGLLKWRLR